MAGTAYAAGAGRIVANEFASMIRPYDQRHVGEIPRERVPAPGME